jgi:hypothetical protein
MIAKNPTEENMIIRKNAKKLIGHVHRWKQRSKNQIAQRPSSSLNNQLLKLLKEPEDDEHTA